MAWKKDIEETQNATVNYPLIADQNLKIAKLYNMLPAEETADGKRTAITNATVRSVFLIDPDKKIRMMLTYPMTTGRNFDEILRVLDSIQLSSKKKIATLKLIIIKNIQIIISNGLTSQIIKML